jgi:acid stress-induced BolA-like protein IbaG/YrbA
MNHVTLDELFTRADLSYIGKIFRSTHQLGEDLIYNQLDDMIHAKSVHVFTICYKTQLSTLNGPSRV